MLLSFGILLILCGLGIMGFGLFIFYAWLPLFYGLLGLEIGLLLGKWLTGDAGAIAIMLGVIGGLAAAASAYFLEPYRRILLGYWGGALVALSLASLLGMERIVGGVGGIFLAVAGGIVGAMLTSKYFDLFVIVASAFGGATLVVAGLQVPLLIAGTSAGSLIPALLTLVLTLIGVSWQLSNAAHWGHPILHDPLADKADHLHPKKP